LQAPAACDMKPSKALIYDLSVAVLLALPTAFLVVLVDLSLDWSMKHDAPIMFYVAYAWDHFGMVPYRDVFDMNPPGTHYLHVFLGKAFSAYHDPGFRFVDLGFLATIMTLNVVWMRRLGWAVAWSGAVLFGIWYLAKGPLDSFQRDYVLLVPILAAIVVSSSTRRIHPVVKGIVIGGLFGIAAAIKPNAAIGLPVVLVYLAIESREATGGWRSARTIVAATLVSAFVPWLLMLLHLWTLGGLAPFLEIAQSYWPLYADLTGQLETLDGGARLDYLLRGYLAFGDQAWWLAPAGVSVAAVLAFGEISAAQKRQIGFILALAFAYSLYALSAGKFWAYHWTPFIFFAIQLASLCWIRPRGPWAGVKSAVPIAVLVLSLATQSFVAEEVAEQLRGAPPRPVKGGRVDALAAWLESHVEPGDSVQPLDTTAGGIHAMLLSESKLATRFVYDFHFHHHVSNPFNTKLRQEFIATLKRDETRYIVQLRRGRGWPSGVDSRREFPALNALLAADYRRVAAEHGYVIYERTPDSR
jgi:hypothetical protein